MKEYYCNKILIVSLVLSCMLRLAVADTVGYWRFENPESVGGGFEYKWLDSSGRDHFALGKSGCEPNDVVFGSPVPLTQTPNNQSLSCPRWYLANDWLKVSDHPDFDFDQTESFTVEAWINFGSKVDYPGLEHVIISDLLQNGWHLAYDPLTGGIKFELFYNNSIYLNVVSDYSLVDNQWHHVAAVREVLNSGGEVVRLFIDGTLQAVDTSTSSSVAYNLSNTKEMFIGKGENYYCYGGMIDELRISSAALHPNEFLNYSQYTNNTIHVDSIFGSNTNTGHSRQDAYQTITYAISQAEQNDTIMVWPGIYSETVDFLGKSITVTSAADAAVLTNPYGYAVRFHTAEDTSSVLKNFVIRDSMIAVQAENSSPTLKYLTVVRNTQGIIADGIASPSISNSILWANQYGSLVNCSAVYSWVTPGQGGVIDQGDPDNPSNTGPAFGNPMFADPNSNDFHLASTQGRFYPQPPEQPDTFGSLDGLWAMDRTDSPCIDAGDPSIIPLAEGSACGERINIGAYANTPYASKSIYPLSADFNRDGIVDLFDFAVLTSQWLNELSWHQ